MKEIVTLNFKWLKKVFTKIHKKKDITLYDGVSSPVDVIMENMISTPESRYIKLLEIEKKYKASDFNINERYVVYVELTSLINTGLYESNNNGNHSIWRRIYDKVLSLCARWKGLVPDFTWYDPDSSYYEDVMTFYCVVKDYVVQNGIIFKADI